MMSLKVVMMKERHLPEEGRSPRHSSSPPHPTDAVNRVASPTTLPLKEHLKRGWDWVVFVWQMLQRLGGPLDILRTFGTILSILMTRLLMQLHLKKRDSKDQYCCQRLRE
jgi:hypothetical protein